MKKFIFIVTASFLTMISCTNKNVEEFRSDESAKLIQQFSAAAGTYGGVMFSKLDGSAKGYMELVLQASIETQPRPDGLGMERRASLAGTILHFDSTRTQISFVSGTYDPKSGMIIVSVPIGDKKIKIIGVISDDKETIVATIEAEGVDPKFGAQATLKKNAPRVSLPNTSTTTLPNETLKYAGKLIFPNNGPEFDVIMSISTSIVDSRVKFYNLLVPTKEVEVSLNIDSTTTVSTPKGFLDTHFQTLDALFEFSSTSGERFTNKFVCSGILNAVTDCALSHPRFGESKGQLKRL